VAADVAHVPAYDTEFVVMTLIEDKNLAALSHVGRDDLQGLVKFIRHGDPPCFSTTAPVSDLAASAVCQRTYN